MAENVEVLKTHTSLLNDQLAKNSARVEKTKQVVNQYEEQIKFLTEIPATLKKSVLIPLGTKGFLRGHIVHTNELYHNVGCGYVIKRTAKQAVEFCDRMLAETNNFLQKLYDEEKWLNEQLKVSVDENVFKNEEQIEIVENYDEETEAQWRLKHRDSVKKMKQEEAKNRENITLSDADVFTRLDELELLEEIDQMNEALEKSSSVQVQSPIQSNALVSFNDIIVNNEVQSVSELSKIDDESSKSNNLECTKVESSEQEVKTTCCTNGTATQQSQQEPQTPLVQQYSNNEEKLRRELSELEKNKRRSEIKRELAKTRKHRTTIRTPDDVSKRLDELEREDCLLEEMELLEENQTEYESNEKNITIRFNEQVRTNFYDCNQAVSEENTNDGEQLPTSDDHDQSKKQTDAPVNNVSSDEPVTLEIRFSHTKTDQTYPTENSTDEQDKESINKTITKPSDLYDLPYRPKSILKNKNKLFEEPQHTGNFVAQQSSWSMPQTRKSKDRSHRDRNWVCSDTFPKNDSDQENANTVQIACPLSEVKEKTDNVVNVYTSVMVPPSSRKTRSRFSVSRALLTKK